MNKMIVAVLGGALCAGCATKEMKSTPFYEGDQVTYVGEASDLVNLWPIVQADTKNNDYRVFPVSWGWDGDEDFYQAVFPFFGWSDDGDWWTPLCGRICTGSSWNGDVESVTSSFRSGGERC